MGGSRGFFYIYKNGRNGVRQTRGKKDVRVGVSSSTPALRRGLVKGRLRLCRSSGGVTCVARVFLLQPLSNLKVSRARPNNESSM